MRLLTANVNGVRAAARRGGLDWIRAQEPDVVTLQEVRADRGTVEATLAAYGFGDWHLALAPAEAAGRAGVAVLSRVAPTEIRVGLGGAAYDGQGRWVETDLRVWGPEGPVVTVVSAYVHTGEAGTARQEEKETFLAHMGDRFVAWAEQGRYAVVTGDLNVAHHEDDLKNWKGNLTKAGFLRSERDHFDRWFAEHGVVDVHRALHGPGPGPYTWWSWRGKAFDNDAGWRIDYHLATGPLAARATRASVGRAETYAQRWSDHAAVVVDYDPPSG